MSGWLPIETAPKGRRIWLRRVYNGAVVAKGWGYYGQAHQLAPMRQPIEPDPLGRTNALETALENETQADRDAAAVGWMQEDGMYRFPEPTEWLPSGVAQRAGA